MSAEIHRLVLENRGRPHVHLWLPKCSCGHWVGIPRRRRSEAVDQHHDHVTNARHPRAQDAPRPLTPRSQLPEGLR